MKSLFTRVRMLIYAVSFLGAALFDAFCGILGRPHVAEDSTYLHFMVAIFALSLLSVGYDVLFNGKRLHFRAILIIVLFSLFYFIDSTFSIDAAAEMQKAYLYFLFFSVPPILIGDLWGSGDDAVALYKYVDLVMVILSVGCIANLYHLVTGGSLLVLYQGLSYNSALSFAFLYYGLLSDRQDRFVFFQSNFFKVISTCMCLLLFITALCSGGRGGVVLFIVEFIVITYFFAKEKLKRYLLALPIFLAVLLVFLRYIGGTVVNTYLDSGVTRAFSYITKEGIDMSETSGRDMVYSEALAKIESSPIMGHGIFYSLGRWGYPHNIFLEFLLGGGVMYCIIWLIILVRCCKTLAQRVRNNVEYFFVVLFVVKAAVHLQFSGTYVEDGLFWFCAMLLMSSGSGCRVTNE